MKAKFWTSEKLLSFTAILISVCTLLVFVYQTNLIREQQYKSVFPYLEMGNFGTNTAQYGFFLTNRGIGPAMIKTMEIHYKDSIYQTDLAGILKKIILKQDSIKYGYSNVNPGSLIPADHEVVLINVGERNMEMGNKLYHLINQPDLDIVIEYESIYGERWRLSYHSERPVKIK